MTDDLSISLEELPDEESLDKASERIKDELASSGSRLARLKWSVVRKTASTVMRERLQRVDTFGAFVRAWSTLDEIRAMARRTRDDPEQGGELLPLASHQLATDLHPIVTIRCGPITLPPLRFTVTVEGEVEGAILRIERGRLAGIEGLAITPSATLSYDEIVLNECLCKRRTLLDPFLFEGGGPLIPCG